MMVTVEVRELLRWMCACYNFEASNAFTYTETSSGKVIEYSCGQARMVRADHVRDLRNLGFIAYLPGYASSSPGEGLKLELTKRGLETCGGTSQPRYWQ